MSQPTTDQAVSSPVRIAICGSMSAILVMEEMAIVLRGQGFEVSTPVREEGSLNWNELCQDEAVATKRAFLNNYFEIIRASHTVIIANTEKHGIEGYVGANTLMEAACAHALEKPIFTLNPVGIQPCQLEVLAISSGSLDESVERFPTIWRNWRDARATVG